MRGPLNRGAPKNPHDEHSRSVVRPPLGRQRGDGDRGLAVVGLTRLVVVLCDFYTIIYLFICLFLCFGL